MRKPRQPISLSSQKGPTEFLPNDKVRIKVGPLAGERGIVRHVSDDVCTVQSQSGRLSRPLRWADVTNYSLAARRAWFVMPKRAGRPRKKAISRVVSLRLDCELLRVLDREASLCLVSRSEVIDRALREMLGVSLDTPTQISVVRK
jgi:hypothetical protein